MRYDRCTAARAQRLIRFSASTQQRVLRQQRREANENALKMAFTMTHRSHVAAIEHGFHGRTAAPCRDLGARRSGMDSAHAV